WGGVEGGVRGGGGGKLVAAAAGGDHGIAGRGADAFADAVGQNHGGDRAPTAASGEKPELADGGEAVSEAGHFFRLAPAVGNPSAHQAYENRCALVNAVGHAHLKRRKTQPDEQGERQHGAHHFG